jgi:hypothetical protein
MVINEQVLGYAFESEITVPRKENDVILKKQDLGELYLPTGKIVANDPCAFFETEPFTVAVEPGSYPVSITVAYKDDNKRVAFAMLRFSDNPPVRWEAAHTGEQNIDELDDDDFGYGVDSGTGGFMDKSVADKITELDLDVYEIFEKQFDSTYVHTYSYAIGSITDGGQNEVAAFSSGYGDGGYPSYFGFDEAGKPCALITDFLVLEDDDDEDD